MGMTIAQKIIAAHLVAGDMNVGSEIALKIALCLSLRVWPGDDIHRGRELTFRFLVVSEMFNF